MNKNFKLSDFYKSKKKGKIITALTAYDFPTAHWEESASIDFILVGDSVGMVMYGEENTLRVTVQDIIRHSKAVRRGAPNTFIVADMPFLSYQTSIPDAIRNAGLIISSSNIDAVKIEGGSVVSDKIKAIIDSGIAVMGHLGLTPQSISRLGAYKLQGKQLKKAKDIIDDAKLLENLGVFSIVLEFIPDEVAEIIKDSISIPVIGIGSGVNCDGQILVVNDILGLNPTHIPKFVKQYSNIGEILEKTFKEYIDEVRNSKFPTNRETFHLEENILDSLKKEIN